MNNKKNLLLGLICSILPIYSFITWIIVFNNPQLHNQLERVNKYQKDFFFDLPINTIYTTILSILLVVASVYFISKTQFQGGYAVVRNIFLLGIAVIGVYFLIGFL